VVDHQVVTMEFGSGASASLTVHGHSHEEGRTMRYDGTRATLRGRFGRTQEITVHSHVGEEVEEVPIPTATSGHGGGDAGIIEAFLDSIEHGKPPATSAAESIESHLLATSPRRPAWNEPSSTSLPDAVELPNCEDLRGPRARKSSQKGRAGQPAGPPKDSPMIRGSWSDTRYGRGSYKASCSEDLNVMS
jgi:hypothetical protein